MFRRINNVDHKDKKFDGDQEKIGTYGFFEGKESFLSKNFLPVSEPMQPVTSFLGLSRCIAPYSIVSKGLDLSFSSQVEHLPVPGGREDTRVLNSSMSSHPSLDWILEIKLPQFSSFPFGLFLNLSPH